MSATSSRAQRLRNRMPAIDPDAPPPVVPVPSPVALLRRSNRFRLRIPLPTRNQRLLQTSSFCAGGSTDHAQAVRTGGRGRRSRRSRGDRRREGPQRLSQLLREQASLSASEQRSTGRLDATMLTRNIPINLSVGVSEYMERTAAALEKRFNDGDPFKSPPVVDQVEKRTRRNTEN